MAISGFDYCDLLQRITHLPSELQQMVIEQVPSVRDQVLLARDATRLSSNKDCTLLQILFDLHGHNIFSDRPIEKRQLLKAITDGVEFAGERRYARSRDGDTQSRIRVMSETRAFREGIDKPSRRAKRQLGILGTNSQTWESHLDSINQSITLNDHQKTQETQHYNTQRVKDENSRLTSSRKHLRFLNVLVDFCTNRQHSNYGWRCAGCIDECGRHSIPGTAALYCNNCFSYAVNTQMIEIREMRRFLGQDEISVDDRMLLTYEFITVHWIHGSNRILRQDADMVTRARFNLDFSDLIRRLDVHGEATFVPFQRDIKRDRLFLSTAAQIKMQYRFPQGIALPRPFILWDTTNYGLPLQLMQHAAAHFPGQALLSEGRAGHDSIIMGLHAVWNANNQQAQDEMIQWNDGRFFVVWWTVEFWQSVLVQLGYSF